MPTDLPVPAPTSAGYLKIQIPASIAVDVSGRRRLEDSTDDYDENYVWVNDFNSNSDKRSAYKEAVAASYPAADSISSCSAAVQSDSTDVVIVSFTVNVLGDINADENATIASALDDFQDVFAEAIDDGDFYDALKDAAEANSVDVSSDNIKESMSEELIEAITTEDVTTRQFIPDPTSQPTAHPVPVPTAEPTYELSLIHI